MSRTCFFTLNGAVIRSRGDYSPSLSLTSTESLLDAYQEVNHILRAITHGQKQLIVQFPFRGSIVRIDLSDHMEGRLCVAFLLAKLELRIKHLVCYPFSLAKTTSVLCAVSIGVGLGSYILYRLYCRFVQPFFKKPPDGQSDDKPQTANKYTETNHAEEEVTMGNNGSNPETVPVHYNPSQGVVFGNRSASIPVASKPRQRRRRAKHHNRSSDEKGRNRLSSSSSSKRARWHESTGTSASSEEGETENPLNISHDGGDDVESGSLKGNLSIRSLSERNMKYGIYDINTYAGVGSENRIEKSYDAVNQERSLERKLDISKQETDNNDTNQPVEESKQTTSSGVDVSAVLLTPPSEEEVLSYANISPKEKDLRKTEEERARYLDIQKSNAESYVTFATPSTGEHTSASEVEETVESVTRKDNTVVYSQTDTIPGLDGLNSDGTYKNNFQQVTSSSENTGSSSSPYKSVSSRVPFSETGSSGNVSCDEEEFDSMSPLQSEKKQDKKFQQSLLHRLYDYATGPSSSTSLESTPEISPYHRHSSGAISDRQESFSDLVSSDIATSDSEIFNTESRESSCAEIEFSKIEGEIHDLDDEFLSLNSKITELMNRSATVSDAELVDQLNFAPASPLARKTRNFVEKKKMKLSRSGTSSLSQSDGSSFSPQHAVSGSGPDLSWEYYDMDPKNLPQNSQLKVSESDNASGSVDMLPRLPVQKSLELPTDLANSDGHTSCEDMLEMDGVIEDVARKSISVKGDVQIGELYNIVEYAEKEWKGDTKTANTIKQAYQEVPRLLHCHNLYQIRGDNYCGIRGTLFQCLTSTYSPVSKWLSADVVLNRLSVAFHSRHSGLSNWTFANRLPYEGQALLSEMSECVQCLFEKFDEAARITSFNERRQWTINTLNSDPFCDIRLMEGVKLLMLLNAIQLHRAYQAEQDVPVFVWLLFARDTSENPATFVKNHLNAVGDSAGLEQVEMCLLGHTLGVTVKVVRLLQLGQEDFVSYYPDEGQDSSRQVCLLAEDDRHYNVPTP